MPLLQPKLNLKVAQRQVLTPGLMQMVSVLALNKVELKEMIDAEMVENPVLEEIDESVPMLDEVAGRQEREERLERLEHEAPAEPRAAAQDSFNEIDFGSYFQDYLDPGYRTQSEYEDSERPSFENFLSQPTTLTDHLAWQLGSLSIEPLLHEAAQFIIGNLDEDGYLTVTDQELAEAFSPFLVLATPAEEVLAQIERGIEVVRQLDPAGVAARDLRECLMLQVAAHQREFEHLYGPKIEETEDNPHRSFRDEANDRLEDRRRSMEVAAMIVDCHLSLLQKRDVKDLSRALQISAAEVDAGIEFIRTLDPRPGRMYNRETARLIEPDVVFTRRGGEWVVSMNEEDLPSLRLSQRYRRMLVAENTDKEVKEYVKERFRSAMQLMRNIAQRKSTILRTCEVIVRRQQDFLEKGLEALHPMMIKEVAEEIGVHPSTVSRAVANKYAHTPQGVLELRFFFTEGSNGPEGADTPLLVLKRKVRKLIDEEDPRRPLTDDQITAILQSQGIQLTRRTVAKYREDMNIPSTHQRRRRDV
jgi:RNA polymerase sigma-54 factor